MKVFNIQNIINILTILICIVWYFWKFQKIARERAAALWNMRNIREKQKQKYVSKCISPCLQGIRMRRSKNKEQKTDVWLDKKKKQQSEKKIHCSFFNFVKKNLI